MTVTDRARAATAASRAARRGGRWPGRRAPDERAVLQVAATAPWLRRYARALVLLDTFALGSTGTVAVLLRFGPSGADLGGVSYYVVVVALCLAWVAALALGRCYETRFLGNGPEEGKRVFDASVRITALLGLAAFAGGVQLARGFVAVFLVLGTALLLAGRFAARVVLRRRRLAGHACHHVLVVGNARDIVDLVGQLRREPLAGLVVVGACTAGDASALEVETGDPVPVVGPMTGLLDALAATGADTVAVASSPFLRGEVLRTLSYELEGTGVDLLVAPALTSVTGTRLSIRPVAGLPLLHLDEPELSGSRQVLKGLFDRVVALVGLVVLAPLLLAVALVVRSTSEGPALFRQQRVGKDGRPFELLKFRSMTVDAEARLEELRCRNEHDGVLFKLRDDPRITRAGSRLRAWSLDELPQLVNVLRGEMSLVGPRPPLPSEVARYEGHTHRRLLVKPGITGLWQVSGRSDLSWEDTVRLDLHYVENWSLGLDVLVLLRTVATVLRRSGAY